MNNNTRKQRLVLLAVLTTVLLSYPFITVANRSALVAGIPVLYLYLFIVWLIIILVLFRLTDRRKNKPGE